MAIFLALAVTLYVGPRFVPGLGRLAQSQERHLPSLALATGWIGGDSLAADALAGHPTLVLVWSDTDPRSLEALQVAEGWHRAFTPLGCRIVAVHSPDFAFGSEREVPVRIAESLGLTLPIALDATLQLQSALGGATDGPHVLVADAAGRVVLDTVGALAAGEIALREVYGAFPKGSALPGLIAVATPTSVRTVYLGAGRVSGGPLAQLSPGAERTLTAEFRYQEQGQPGVPYPVGRWRAGTEGATSMRAGAADFVSIRYSAHRAAVVVSPPAGGTGRLWVLLDEHWPRSEEAGADVAFDGHGAAYIDVTEPRLYWLEQGAGERVIKISPATAGLTVHAFVFEDPSD
ncbi:MAG: hypothetical protein ABIU54_04650 [Candidatus Eisenbacteria bacterium]